MERGHIIRHFIAHMTRHHNEKVHRAALFFYVVKKIRNLVDFLPRPQGASQWLGRQLTPQNQWKKTLTFVRRSESSPAGRTGCTFFRPGCTQPCRCPICLFFPLLVRIHKKILPLNGGAELGKPLTSTSLYLLCTHVGLICTHFWWYCPFKIMPIEWHHLGPFNFSPDNPLNDWFKL